MNILTVLGTRPETIKLAPLILRLRKDFSVTVCVTGQHREMLDQVLDVFDLSPEVDLKLMKPNQTLAEVTNGVIKGVSSILKNKKFEWVVVQGDTTSAMATALAAFYQKVRVAHVEAGLRTWNKQHPFPEEINRQLTSRIADLHFAPTKKNHENLIEEGVAQETVHLTGNTVIDALQWVLNKTSEPKWNFPFNPKNKRFILITCHRRENFGKGLEQICNAIKQLAHKNPEIEFVYPVHLNPNVQKPVKALLNNIKNVHLLEPLDYLKFVHLMNRANIILTDSGGVQEEAPALGKPLLVMRDTTERPEALDAGTAKLIGTDQYSIVESVQKLLDNHIEYKTMAVAHNPYGDGTASDKIIKILKSFC